MRIAHLIITYTNPLQTARMIESMQHPGFDFYVHVDKKLDITDHLFLAKQPNVFLIQNRVNVVWGGYNTVEATIQSVKEIFSTGKPYEYIHLMSGQDYPIKPAEYIFSFFKANRGKEFLAFEHFDEWADEAYPRIREYHFTNYKFPGRYLVQRLVNRILPERKSPIPMDYYGESMFWALSTNCLRYIIHLLDHNTRFRRFMQFTWGSDEFMFQTLVLNSSFKDQVVKDNLLYLDRDKGAPHPNIITTSHLERILDSAKLFARKFDLKIDAQVMDLIDQYIHETEAGPENIQHPALATRQ